MTDETAAAPADKEVAAPAADASAAAAVTPPAGSGTIVDGADAGNPAADGKPAAKAADGAADWRTEFAGEDAEALKRLARFPDKQAMWKSYRAMEQRMSSGELKKALPEGASPEELATYRKENGLPDKPEAYVEKLELPNGVVIGEADKPVVASFAEAALAGNVDPKAFNGLVAKYYEMQDKQRVEMENADAAFKQSSEDALRAEWQGADYRQNLTAIQNMMAGWPEGLATRVLAGRTPDGRKLGDDPVFVRQLAVLSRELNPAATLVPVGTTNPAKGVTDELASIRQMRRENPDKYEADKQLQARELELIDADLKMKRRA